MVNIMPENNEVLYQAAAESKSMEGAIGELASGASVQFEMPASIVPSSDSAFRDMSAAFRTVMDRLKTGAKDISSVVNTLPVSVKKATMDLCNAIKVGASKIWKAIKAGSKELYSVIQRAWGSVLSHLSKVLEVMSPLLSTGKDTIKRGAEITLDLSRRVLKGMKSTVKTVVKRVRKAAKKTTNVARLQASRGRTSTSPKGLGG